MELSHQEKSEVTVLCLIEMAAKVLKDRTTPKTRRANKIDALLQKVEEVNETYHGYLRDDYVARAERFYQEVEDSLTRLVNYSQKEEAMEKFTELKDKVVALEEDAKKFFENGNKAAGTRLRVGLQEVKTLAQDVRKEVSATKNAE